MPTASSRAPRRRSVQTTAIGTTASAKPLATTRARSCDRRDGQAPDAERGHQPAEDLCVAGVPVQVDRGDEDRQSPRRVLDREVAIRQQAVVDRTPVALVDGRVGDHVPRVEPVVQDDPAADEHRGRGGDAYTASNAIAANGKNHGR